MELKNVPRYEIYKNSPFETNEGEFYYVTDIKYLFKKIGYLTDLNLKNDSYRHNIIFKGVNITYRLSVTKSHFWIYNIDTGQEVQYINHDNGLPECYCNGWESFLEEEWDNILEDMR